MFSGIIKFIISNAALSWPQSEWSEQYFHVRTRTTKLSSHRPSEGQTVCCPAILIFSFQLLHITLLKPCQVNQNIDRKVSFPPFSHISSSQHGRESSLCCLQRRVYCCRRAAHCIVMAAWHGMQVRGICINFIANQTFNIRHPLRPGVSRGCQTGPLLSPSLPAFILLSRAG